MTKQDRKKWPGSNRRSRGPQRCRSNPPFSYVDRVPRGKFKPALRNHPTSSQDLVKLSAQNGPFVHTEGFKVPWLRSQHCAAEQAVRPPGHSHQPFARSPVTRPLTIQALHSRPPTSTGLSRGCTCSPKSHPLDVGREPHRSLPLVPGRAPRLQIMLLKIKGRLSLIQLRGRLS